MRMVQVLGHLVTILGGGWGFQKGFRSQYHWGLAFILPPQRMEKSGESQGLCPLPEDLALTLFNTFVP